MTARTTVKSGLWSDPTVFSPAAVPVDTDTVTIITGHTITFDQDQSGFATGVGVTIQKGAILQASTIAGAYVLKCSANIVGSATGSGATAALNAGSAGTPYPANCSFVINLNGAHTIDLTLLNMSLYCVQPANMSVKLSAPAIVGATVLSVDRDVSADAPWLIASARCNVDNVNTNNQSEARLISGVSASTVTITVGLTAAKIAGTWIHLMQRNVRITGSTGNAVSGSSAAVLRCEISGNSVGISGGNGHTISGTVTSTNSGISAGTGHNISGIISGNSTGVNTGVSHIISGTVSGNGTGIVPGPGFIISGTVSGNGTGVSGGSGFSIISGTVSGNGTGVSGGSGKIIYPAVFSSNTQDIQLSVGGCWVGYGAYLSSGTQVANYATLEQVGWQGVFMWDIGNVAGALKAWMYGGRIISDTGTVPPGGPTTSMNHIFEVAATPVYLDYPVTLRAGVNTFTIYMRKDTNGMTETPNAQIVLPGADPFFGGVAAAQVTMLDNTLTWQTLTLSYTSARQQAAVVRVRGANASGNMWQAIVLAGGGLLTHPGMAGGMRG